MSGGDGELRIRVGDYWVIYDVQDDEFVVLVVRGGHVGWARRDIRVGDQEIVVAGVGGVRSQLRSAR
ncbi:hypothetical protein [Falsarthrobacter nasiphocae]|uniref:type II toxin-antitoxin system RelE family toxin n=1 Tax=Falsarthrobacter nasiphocae TaxID=189863 RepID=UPI0031D2CA6C